MTFDPHRFESLRFTQPRKIQVRRESTWRDHAYLIVALVCCAVAVGLVIAMIRGL